MINTRLSHIQIAFFDDPLVKTLSYFESLMQMDNQQKMNFFKSLPQVITRFEKVRFNYSKDTKVFEP